VPGTDRRTRILHHASALLAEKGINGCTVRGIAEEVGMLSGSLYHHFASKDEIVAAIVSEYLSELAAGYREGIPADAPARERLYHLVHVSLSVAVAHRDASRIYQSNRDYFADNHVFAEVRHLATQVHDVWVDLIESGVREGALRDDIDSRLFHRFLRDAVFLASRWYRPTRRYPVEALARDTAAIYLDGFAARP
jgi:AcrR family transcriptional regulator